MLEKPNMESASLIVPERLTKKEEKEIVGKVDDDRLHNDENVEHFTVHLGDRVVNIPKRNVIHIKKETGMISSIKTADYIQQVIDEYDS